LSSSAGDLVHHIGFGIVVFLERLAPQLLSELRAHHHHRRAAQAHRTAPLRHQHVVEIERLEQ
jgi:hypothetical protein